MFNNIGSTELIIITIVGLFLFGSNKVNKTARRLGEAKKELENAKDEYDKALSEDAKEDAKEEIIAEALAEGKEPPKDLDNKLS